MSLRRVPRISLVLQLVAAGIHFLQSTRRTIHDRRFEGRRAKMSRYRKQAEIVDRRRLRVWELRYGATVHGRHRRRIPCSRTATMFKGSASTAPETLHGLRFLTRGAATLISFSAFS